MIMLMSLCVKEVVHGCSMSSSLDVLSLKVMSILDY